MNGAVETGAIISLALYFIGMLGIGVYAWRKSTDDVSGYLLGGRRLSPSVAALSAGASDMSGWLLLGLPGAAYLSGVSAAWIAIGLFAGALANYLIVAPRLRVHTEQTGDSITIPEFFERRLDDRSHALRIVSALVIILFFTLYTSSGMVAGGKLFETAFGADYALGLWVTAGVVILYTLIGGFLAVSLTDFVQGIIMFVALIMVPLVAFAAVDGDVAQEVARVNPDALDLFAGTTFLGIVSSLAWGLGYFGQPHIITRFMAVRSVRDVPTMRNIGMSWMAVSLVGALATGFIGLAYATQNGLAVEDPETIFILLSQILFHPLITGFLYAALLAAIMSTISSQLLVSSSSLTEDFYRVFLRRNASQRELVTVGRASVLAVALAAIGLAYSPDNSILGLVADAWAGFGAAFGPLVVLSLTWRRLTLPGALAGVLVGAGTVLLCILPLMPDGQSFSEAVVYAMVPGFLLSFIAIVLVSLATRPAAAAVEQFDESRAAMAGLTGER
jgi:SSS family solute:Na+ symporter/sodium/proline symporter